jgi:hypothetical protein
MFRKSLFIFLLFFTTTASADYGALAYSPDDMAYGYSFDWDTTWEAENKAERQCRKQVGSDDCMLLEIFKRCGALAVGKGGKHAYGAGKGKNKATARQRALKDCKNNGGRGCKIGKVVCNSN